MVKGIARRVVVIKSPDPRIFDEAIFLVKDDARGRAGVTNDEILREAQDAAMQYVQSVKGRPIPFRLPAPLWALAGAGGTGLVWLLTALLL